MTHMTPEQQRRKTFQTFVRDSEARALEAQREYEAAKTAIQFIIWTVLVTVFAMVVSCGIQLLNQWVGGAV